jgi:hypothetical protein
MTVLESRSYLTGREKVIADLIPKRCAGCIVALEVATEVIDEFQAGEIYAGDIPREYDLRAGGKCSLGLIELSDEVKVCLIDPKNIRQIETEDTPRLIALED